MVSPAPPASPPPEPDVAAAKRALLRMVGLIVVIDVVAIAVYYGAHIALAPPHVQEAFTITWMVIGLLIVTTQLRRIRIARYGGSRRRRR
jgi:hypothetical protein